MAPPSAGTSPLDGPDAPRRAHRRSLTAVAWSLGVVLLVGAGVVVLAELRPAQVDEQVRLPVAAPVPSRTAPSPTPSTPPTPPAPVREVLRPAADAGLDVASVLGPPPGPQVDRRPERVAAPEDRYAFLAGVSDYRRPTRDTIAGAADVRMIRAALLEQGWLPQNVRVVADGQATGAALREGMRWLAAKGRPGTFSLFHFSGHVKQQGGTREALWPVDRDFVGDTEVTALLSKVRGRMWVDIAGCEAGSFLPGLPSDRVLVSASSKQTEKSYEYPPWTLSVWTGLLFDLGLRQRQADADGDGRTTMGETLRYASYYAQVITLGQRPYGRQTPQVAGADDLGWTLADPPA